MHLDMTALPCEARDHEACEARVAKLVSDIDTLVTLTVKALNKSKLQTIRRLGSVVGGHALALRLSIAMERPACELIDSVTCLAASLGELRLMSSRARIDQSTQMALALLEKMVAQLCGDLAGIASASNVLL